MGLIIFRTRCFFEFYIITINQFNLTIKLIEMQTGSLNEQKQSEMIQTNFKMSREHSDQMPYPLQRQIDIVISNIKFYVSLLISNRASVDEIEDIKKALVTQLQFINSDFVHTERIQKLSDSIKIDLGRPDQGYQGYQKVEQFGETIKKLMAYRNDTESQQEFENLNKIIQGFLKEMEVILLEDNYTVSRLEKYQIEDNNLQKSCSSNDKQVEQLPPGHFWVKQKIIFRSEQPPKVFQEIQPPLHRVYLSEVTKVYHDVVPFKIKFVCLSSLQEPKIDTKNYFDQQIESEKAIVHYCKPGTKTLISYRLEDLSKLLTFEKQYAMERELPVNWVFGQYAKTLITPDGKIFGLNCRTSQKKQDSSLYEITPQKVSNKGRVPEPKRNSSIVYCNKCLYIIGGNNDNEKCSAKNFKYNIRQKKFLPISDSNVALRKPTICAFRDRYIFKIGGLNQFDYINKVIQIYDTTTDKWSTVRANPKNVLEQVQILQDSLAVQIGEDQIYVFAGKNTNGYRSDTGLVLNVMQIREKIKAPAKVSGELWNVSIGKKNILSFFGLFSQSNVITHGNCLYAMRSQTCHLERI